MMLYLEAVVDVFDAALGDGRARQRHAPTATQLTTHRRRQISQNWLDITAPSAIDVINAFHVFLFKSRFYVFNVFFFIFFNVSIINKHCQMQSTNMQKSNKKYS